MKYIIDENICKKHDLAVEELFCILACKSCNNLYTLIEKMKEQEKLSKETPSPYPTLHWDQEVCSVLLESDDAIPKKDDCKELAEALRELFPRGIKVGNSAWRGNVREITLRLQKFFKLYGNRWSNDEIVDATKRYVDHFNGDFTYMRILKYFIMKSDRVTGEDGTTHIEDISELATWLENQDMETDVDWTTSLV